MRRATSSPGRNYRAIAESRRHDIAAVVARSGRYHMPSEHQDSHRGESKSAMNTVSLTHACEDAVDTAPSHRRTIRDTKHNAPNKTEPANPCVPCRRASPQEDVRMSPSSWPQDALDPTPQFEFIVESVEASSHSLRAPQGHHNGRRPTNTSAARGRTLHWLKHAAVQNLH